MKVEGNQLIVENCPNPDGSKAVDSWTFASPEEAEKQLAQFEEGVAVRTEIKPDGSMRYATEKILKGDASALRDAAEEHRKQRES